MFWCRLVVMVRRTGTADGRILIDGKRLGNPLIEHDVGVRVGRVVQFRRLDVDTFNDEA